MSESLAQTLTQVRAVVERLRPLEPRFVTGSFRALVPELEAIRAELRERGLFAPWLQRGLGGMGLDLLEFARVAEELGRSPLGHYTFHCQAPDVGNTELLMQHGTPEQKERYLLPLAHGQIRSCFSMTEPELAGSNPVLMNTSAEIEGDELVINGHKWFTSSAEGAAFAIVMAVTDPDAPEYARASMIIVPTDTKGFRLVRNVSVMGHSGDDYHSHAEVRYEDCRVPTANILGPRGAGFKLAQDRLGPGRIHHAMRWIGIAERAFDLMCERAATREISKGRPLGTKQLVQAFIADSRAEIDAARLMVLKAAEAIELRGAASARDEISTIKFFVANVLGQVLDRSIQVHGALGLTDDLPLAFWYRSERAARIYDGPDEVHKSAVARRILKKRFGIDVKD
ncbi:MAG: acyl-CoA dehydrogenase family protein [Deltaproteobacteria bacterium]|nr:acyl-CoA dehydrogenase family protein [Deltaproteobacteria bacterium]